MINLYEKKFFLTLLRDSRSKLFQNSKNIDSKFFLFTTAPGIMNCMRSNSAISCSCLSVKFLRWYPILPPGLYELSFFHATRHLDSTFESIFVSRARLHSLYEESSCVLKKSNTSSTSLTSWWYCVYFRGFLNLWLNGGMTCSSIGKKMVNVRFTIIKVFTLLYITLHLSLSMANLGTV